MPVSLYEGAWRYGDRLLHEGGAEQSGDALVTITGLTLQGSSAITYPIIVHRLTLTEQERVQTFESFNDVVHVYAYGQSAGLLTIEGSSIADRAINESHVATIRDLLTPYRRRIRAFKAAQQQRAFTQIYLPSKGYVEGVIVGLTLGFQDNPFNVASFTLQVIVTNSRLD